MTSTIRMFRFKVLLVALILVPQLALAVGEQYGSISGQLLEAQTNVPVPGAEITLSGPTLLGGPQKATTAEDGTFEFRNLFPGVYDVLVSYAGVKPVRRRIDVRAGGTTPLQIAWSAELAQVETTVVQEESHPTRPDTSTIGATFSMDKQNLLATPRQYQSVVTQAPGVTQNASGNPRVRGANDRNNRVLIDGLDTTDPVTNTFSANLNQDSIAAVQVITAGMEAKYNALGAVQNIITKSGSDELHFDIAFYTRQKWLQTFHDTGNLLIDGDKPFSDAVKPPSQSYSGNFSINGPIILHQLWYSASLEVDQSSVVSPPGLPLNRQAPNRIFTNYYPRLKLTWAPSSQHRFSIEGLGDPTYIDYENNNSATANNTEPLAANGRFQGGWKALGRWDYYLSPTLEFQVFAGWSFNSLDVGPQGKVRKVEAKYGTYDVNAPRHVNNFDGTAWRNGLLEQSTYRHRLQLDASTTIRAKAAGSHEIELGAQSSYLYHKITNDYTGNGFSYSDGLGPNGGPLDTRLCDDDPFVIPTNDPSAPAHAGCSNKTFNQTYTSRQRGFTLGLYGQDRWKPTSWLTVLPGLRWDISRAWIVGGDPNQDYVQVSGFGPRLSAIADLTGDKKTILQVGYGRSTEMVYLTALSTIDGTRKASSTTYTWNGTQFVQAAGGLPSVAVADNQAREAPHSDEINARISREVFRNTVVEATYTYKILSNMLEGIDTNRIWDPSGNRIIGGLDPTIGRRFLFTYPKDNWVKYSGFDLVAEARPTPNWDLYAVYTLGWTWGTAITQNAFQSPGSQYDDPRYRQFYIGYIPEADVRHTIRSQVTYNFRGITAGATFTYQSGFALRKTFQNPASNLTPTVRAPFGLDPGAPPASSGLNNYRNWSEFRTPDVFQITLLLGYDFFELLRQHLLLTVGIENLFDSITPGGVSPLVRTADTAPPSQFGLVAGRPSVPFRVQLGLRYTY